MDFIRSEEYGEYIRYSVEQAVQDWPGILQDGVFILSVKIVFLCDGYKLLMETITSAGNGEPRGPDAGVKARSGRQKTAEHL